MEKILLAVDGSPHSLRAAQYVVQLMRGAVNRELHVVHVEEAVPMRSHAFMSQEEIDKMYEKEALERCAEVLDYLKAQGIPHRWQLLVGEAAERIVAHASAIGANAIVIGSHGRSAIGSLVLGSVATQVVHDAAMPVTIVK